MLNSEEDFTDLRMLLPEIIWLEPEHFERARAISDGPSSEAQQWQTYLNMLALFALEEWLNERIGDRNSKSKLGSAPAVNREINLIEPLCYLKVGEFKLAAIATEHLLEEVVNFPGAAIDNPCFAAHFYVLLEVREELEEVIIRAFLRHDQLKKYCNKTNLEVLKGNCCRLPLSLFDAEINHLLFDLHYLEPNSIPLPVDSKIESPLLNLTTTKLEEWLEGIFADDWLSFDKLLQSEKNLAWSVRTKDEEGAKAGKLINLGIQLASQTVTLLVTLTPEADRKVGILIQLCPAQEERYLPANLKLMLRSKTGEILQSVRSRLQDNYIQLKPFRGNRGVGFSVEVSIGNTSITENFVI